MNVRSERQCWTRAPQWCRSARADLWPRWARTGAWWCWARTGCGAAGRLLRESRRAVASARSGRNREQTREHENRERRCRHDGCAHHARTHDKGPAHRGASLVVPRRAELRPRLRETLRVPRRGVPQDASAWLREGFGSRQEIVVAPGHDSNPSSHRLTALPHPLHGGRTRERSWRLVRPVGGWRHPGTLTGCPLCAPGALLKASAQGVPPATRSQGTSTPSTVRRSMARRGDLKQLDAGGERTGRVGGLPPPFLPAGSHSCEWAELPRELSTVSHSGQADAQRDPGAEREEREAYDLQASG